jgi:hypothetical protein
MSDVKNNDTHDYPEQGYGLISTACKLIGVGQPAALAS